MPDEARDHRDRDAEDTPVGRVGELVAATRGEEGPGEVRIAIRGGTELYLAWSPEPLTRGTDVLVVHSRAAREVDVEPWEGRLMAADPSS